MKKYIKYKKTSSKAKFIPACDEEGQVKQIT